MDKTKHHVAVDVTLGAQDEEMLHFISTCASLSAESPSNEN